MKTFIESKKEMVKTASFFAVMFLVIAFWHTFNIVMLYAFLILIIIGSLVVWLYPRTEIVFTEAEFNYKRGRKSIKCPWSDVIGIYLVPTLKMPVTSKKPITSFNTRPNIVVIQTNKGITDLISTPFLQYKENSNELSGDLFMQELKRLTGKEFLYGDTSTVKGTKVGDSSSKFTIILAIIILACLIFAMYIALSQ